MPRWLSQNQWVSEMGAIRADGTYNRPNDPNLLAHVSFLLGISIAGEGGVASAKPNAIALTGRNGLALTAPKATAIAGITPEEAAAFSIRFPNRHHLVIKRNREQSSAQPSPDYAYELLESLPAFRLDSTVPTLRNEDRVKPLIATTSAMDAVMQAWRNSLRAAYDGERPHHQLHRQKQPTPTLRETQ